MIGVSLPFGWLLRGGAPYGERGALLDALKAHGVRSCELRSVHADTPPADVLAAASLVHAHGLAFTVHGSIRSAASAVQDVLAPLSELLAANLQEKIIVTVHPVCGCNAAVLTALADAIEAASLPVMIALENNRLMPDKSEGDSAALAAEAAAAADRGCIGICFDMGHYFYYRSKHTPETPNGVPPRAFLRRCIHTHIHAMEGGRTHFPLSTGALPLTEYIAALECGYFGLYNIEHDPPRWPERDARAALLASVDRLAQALGPCARLYDDIRTNFDARFTTAAKMEAEKGTAFALVQSTAYLFCTNGFRWAMDASFRYAYTLAKTPAMAAELFADYRLMLISHSHDDHFEERTIRALASGTAMHFILPPFLAETARKWGVPDERMTIAEAGVPLTFGPLTILPFESRHFRPNGGSGVPEYGYRIEAPDTPSMIFPVDVRDYAGRLDVPPADICFGNVWFGDDNTADTRAACEAEAEFLLRLSAKTIILTHLYENGRTAAQMWRREHAEALAAAIHARSSETAVVIPQMGEQIRL